MLNMIFKIVSLSPRQQAFKFRSVLISSYCLFRNADFFVSDRFETVTKHRKKPKILFFVLRKKPKQNRNRSSFGLFQSSRKKKSCPCPSYNGVLISSFGLFRKPIFCFGSFRNGSETPKQNENICLVSRKRPKQNKTGPVRFVSVRTETKNCLFRGHPTRHPPQHRLNKNLSGNEGNSTWCSTVDE